MYARLDIIFSAVDIAQCLSVYTRSCVNLEVEDMSADFGCSTFYIRCEDNQLWW